MVVICNTDNKENNKRLHSYLFAYESVLRTGLLPSAKILAQVLVYQGALKEDGCCITNEVLGSFTLLDAATVQRQTGILTKAKVFHRHREGRNNPYTYYFNRNTEEWEVEKYV